MAAFSFGNQKKNARAKQKKYGKEIKNNKTNCAGGAPHSVSVSWISLLRLLFSFCSVQSNQGLSVCRKRRRRKFFISIWKLLEGDKKKTSSRTCDSILQRWASQIAASTPAVTGSICVFLTYTWCVRLDREGPGRTQKKLLVFFPK